MNDIADLEERLYMVQEEIDDRLYDVEDIVDIVRGFLGSLSCPRLLPDKATCGIGLKRQPDGTFRCSRCDIEYRLQPATRKREGTPGSRTQYEVFLSMTSVPKVRT